MSTRQSKRRLRWGGIVQCFILLAVCTTSKGQDWKEKLAFAESQHNIIITLIDEGKYGEVMPELRKIVDLKFPEKYEERLTREFCMVSDKLRHKDQDSLAHEVLDEGLRSVTVKGNKARLYKEKGYLYKKQGDKAKAIEMFREASKLESK